MTKIILLAVTLFASAVFAAGGQFLIVKGEVKLTSGSLSVPAKVGTKVKAGDLVETNADSRAKIVMTDRNVINISPNTRLKIEEYASGKVKNVKLSLLSGKIRNDVMQKYDNDKNKFEVRTPTAVAGVRGTQFITSYDEAQKLTEVVTLVGQVEVRTLRGGITSDQSVMVRQGEKSQVDSTTTAPKAPEKIPQGTLDEINVDTNVRRDNQSPTPTTATPIVKNPRDIKNPLIENAVGQKYDKTKVNVNPRPPGN